MLYLRIVRRCRYTLGGVLVGGGGDMVRGLWLGGMG